MAHGESLRATHRNGTVTTTPVKVLTRRGRGFRLRLFNNEASGGDNLEISFDSGNNFYPIVPQGEMDEAVTFHFFYVRAAAGSVDYRALLFEG